MCLGSSGWVKFGLWVLVLDKAWGRVGFQGVVALWGETESRQAGFLWLWHLSGATRSARVEWPPLPLRKGIEHTMAMVTCKDQIENQQWPRRGYWAAILGLKGSRPRGFCALVALVTDRTLSWDRVDLQRDNCGDEYLGSRMPRTPRTVCLSVSYWQSTGQRGNLENLGPQKNMLSESVRHATHEGVC